MVLRKKDGSIYQLRKPNKILAQQNLWFLNEGYITYHLDQLGKDIIEINSNELISKNESPKILEKPVELQQKDEPKDINSIIELIDKNNNQIKEKEPDIINVLKEKELPKEIEEKNQTDLVDKSQFRKLNKTYLLCLPSFITQYKDPLYGEESLKISYKQPIRVQVSIIQTTDVRMVFWTTIEDIKAESILFNQETRRWWKVTQVKIDEKEDGFIFFCVPSDLKPDFSSVDVK